MEEKQLEEFLLGRIILEPNVLEKHVSSIHEKLFQYPLNKEIFSLINTFREEGTNIDMITLTNVLKSLQTIVNGSTRSLRSKHNFLYRSFK